jgi:hypothetical protein
MLAAELSLAGIDVVVAERRPCRDFAGSRAGGLHARTIEVLDQRGIADRFLAAGKPMQIQSFAGVSLDIGDFPADWIDELGVPIARDSEVTGVTQDDAGIDVQLSDGRLLRAGYLVGCDGGRSLVRNAADIDFPGWEPSVSSLIAEVELREEPEWGIRHDENGTQAISKLEGGKRAGVVVSERYAGQTGEPTLQELSRALVAAWGTDYGVNSPTRISRLNDATRQAASYRRGRVLLAGDAAHVHYPVGGQGLKPRRTGRCQPRLEARRSRQRNSAAPPPRHLPRRAAPGRCPHLADDDGRDRAHPLRRASRRAARHPVPCLSDGRAAQAPRRDDLRPRHSLRPRRGRPAARPSHARPRPDHRRGPAAFLHRLTRCRAGAPQPRRVP